jgi:hypothetical protein
MNQSCQNKREEQDSPTPHMHLWLMRWFLTISLVLWILLSTVATAVMFFTRADPGLGISLFVSIAPPIYLLHRLTNYLFPISARDAQLERLKIHSRTRATDLQKEKPKEEDRKLKLEG